MKNLFKFLLCIFLIFTMIFSLCSCFSPSLIFSSFSLNEIEQKAQEQLEVYLRENFNDFHILKTNEYSYKSGFTTTIDTGYVEFVVKIGNEKFNFMCYPDTGEIYSDRNYNKVYSELKEYFLQKDFMKKSKQLDMTLFVGYDKEMLLDEHENLNDLIGYTKEEKETFPFAMYSCSVKVYLANEENINPETIMVDDWFVNIPSMELIIYNCANENLNPKFILDQIEMGMWISDEEKTLKTTYIHNECLQDENGLFVLYNDNYFNVNIQSKKNINDNPYLDSEYSYGKKYTPIGNEYSVTIDCFNKPEYTEKGGIKINTTTDNFDKTLYLSDIGKMIVYIPSNYRGTYFIDSKNGIAKECDTDIQNLWIDDETDFSFGFYQRIE